jgi:hypothetical protein
MARVKKPKLRVGAIKTEKGKKYRLNENFRWERIDTKKTVGIGVLGGLLGSHLGEKLNVQMFRGRYRNIVEGTFKTRRKFGPLAGSLVGGAMAGFLIPQSAEEKGTGDGLYDISRKRVARGILGVATGLAAGAILKTATDPITHMRIKNAVNKSETYDRWMATMGRAEKHYLRMKKAEVGMKEIRKHYKAGMPVSEKQYKSLYRKYTKSKRKYMQKMPTLAGRMRRFIGGRID